jgi:hypothetical protein
MADARGAGLDSEQLCRLFPILSRLTPFLMRHGELLALDVARWDEVHAHLGQP